MEIFRKIYRKIIAKLTDFSPELTSKIYYFTKIKKRLNLKNPKTFNEKLMYLKLNEYEENELITKCADKYAVREYVTSCGCTEILNELYGVFDNAEDINFEKLPDKFVLKCNHGAGFNIICNDKSKLDIKQARKKLNKWLKTDYWKFVAELQYKNIDKKIICEKLLENSTTKQINDYKIYCFNGIPKFCMVCIGREEYKKPKYYFMDKNWNVLKINPDGISLDDKIVIDKPKCIDKMYDYAQKLSKPFKFVRVDLYECNEKIIFGELTFTPAGCIDANYTKQAQYKLGEMIEIKR